MKPTAKQLRENIIIAKQRGEKGATIAFWFNISLSTVDKIWRRFKETGSVSATPYTGRKSSIGEDQEEQIKEVINKNPDITLAELIEELSLPITVSALCRKLQKMGLTYKKRPSTLKPNNAPMCRKSAVCGKKIKRS